MSYQGEVLADSPLGFWRLQETSGTAMVDSSGNARHGTYVNTPTLGAAGFLPGSASVDFDGTNDNATIADAAWMDVSSLTLEQIIQPDSVAGTRMLLTRDSGTNPDRVFQWRINASGKLEFTFWTPTTGPHVLAGSTTLIVGTTYHVAVTYNAATGVATIWLNGVSDGTTTQGTGLKLGNTPGVIAGIGGGGNYFDGRMEEVAWYGTALSSARLLAHVAAMADFSITVPPFDVSLSIPTPAVVVPVTVPPFLIDLSTPAPAAYYLNPVQVPPFDLSLSQPAMFAPDIPEPDPDEVEQAVWIDVEDEVDVPSDPTADVLPSTLVPGRTP